MKTNQKELIIMMAALGLILGCIFNWGVRAEWVHGYSKSNGTYVNGYYRTSPDNSPYNNYNPPNQIDPYEYMQKPPMRMQGRIRGADPLVPVITPNPISELPGLPGLP